jgi:hypothetical protein
MSNQINLFNNPQLYPGPDDGNAGGSIVSIFNGVNEYASVTDNDNIRITDIASTELGFSVCYRIKQLTFRPFTNGDRRTIFFKIDDDAVNYAYMVQLDNVGNVFWYVIENGIVRNVFGYHVFEVFDAPDFDPVNFNPLNYSTVLSPSVAYDTVPYHDLWFVYKFATKRMQIILDGKDITADDSTLSFDGTNDYVDCGISSTNDVGTTAGSEVSHSFWVYYTANPAASAALMVRAVTFPFLPYISSAGNMSCDVKYQDGTTWFASAGALTKNMWNNVIITHSDVLDISKIYLNGVLKGSNVKNNYMRPPGAGSQRLLIAADPTGASTQALYAPVKMDDCKIWNRALTQAEVTAIWTGDYSVNTDSGLVFYLPMKEGQGTIINDVIQGLPCTLVNGPVWVKPSRFGVTIPTPQFPVPLSININQDIFTMTASAEETGFEATKANDNLTATLWKKISGFGSWLKADLGSVTVLTLVKISWYLGHQRKYNYVIETSLDNVVWTNVKSGASSGLTESPEIYDFTNIQGRYVRVTVNGNNINNEAGIYEFDVYGGANEGQPEQPPEFADFTPFYEVAAGTEGGGSTGFTEVYNVTNVGGSDSSRVGNGLFADGPRTRTGEKLANGSSILVGKKLTKVEFWLRKFGSPTGTCTARIRKGSDNSVVVTSATLDVSTLTTSDVKTTFLFPGNTYALQSGDKVLVEYGGGDTTNYIMVRRLTETDNATLDPFDGNNTIQTGYENSPLTWVDRADRDISGIFYIGGGTVIPDNYETLKYGATPFSSPIYDVALPGTPNTGPLNDQKTRRGEVAINSGSDMLGTKPTKFTMFLRKVGTPTGILTACIINKDSNLIKGTFGTIDVSTLTTSFVEYTFTNTGLSYPIAIGDLVGAIYEDGTATNYVDVAYTETNAFDVDSGKIIQTGSVWGSPDLNRDQCGKLYSGGSADPSNKLKAGILVNATDSIIANKLPTQVLVYLKKAGSPTGTVYIRLRKGIDDTIATEYGTISASLLTTTMTAYLFTNVDAAYRPQINDKLLVEYEPPIGETSASNQVLVKIWHSDQIDGTKTCMVTHSGQAYSGAILDQEFSGIVYEGGQLISGLEEAIPQPPEYSKDLYINAAIRGTDLSLDGNIFGYNNCISCEFHFYWMVVTVAQALNYFTNRITTSSIALGHVAQCGYSVFTS